MGTRFQSTYRQKKRLRLAARGRKTACKWLVAKTTLGSGREVARKWSESGWEVAGKRQEVAGKLSGSFICHRICILRKQYAPLYSTHKETIHLHRNMKMMCFAGNLHFACKLYTNSGLYGKPKIIPWSLRTFSLKRVCPNVKN